MSIKAEGCMCLQGSDVHHEPTETTVERLTMPTAMRMLHNLEKTQVSPWSSTAVLKVVSTKVTISTAAVSLGGMRCCGADHEQKIS